jgi:uncharacterized protein
VRWPLALTALVATLVVALLGPMALLKPARADTVPIPAAPTAWVTDNSGVLSMATRDALESQLAEYARSSGHQVIVWIGETTGDAPLEDWTIRAFTQWKVGRKGLDDGLALFIFMRDHKVRIEVGYGLEGQVTDARASDIARNIIAAKLKTGDVDGAVSGGVNALIAAIGGASAEQTGETNGTDTAWVWGFVLSIFFVVFVLVLVIRSARYATGRGYTIGSSGSGPGWWGGLSSGGFSSGGFSGGGGFGGLSGGGGMGGGGGASASW